MNRELAKLTDEIDAIVKRGNYVSLDPHEAGAIVAALRHNASPDSGATKSALPVLGSLPSGESVRSVMPDHGGADAGVESEAWQTVPTRPTPKMLYAAEKTDKEMRDQGFANAEPEAIYYAMLDAAPDLASGLVQTQPAGERREAIARIIDPVAFAGMGFLVGDRQKMALSKADAILASGLVQDEAGWQPIETAPKDGTEILLFTRHEGDDFCEEPFTAVQIGYWDEGCADTDWYREAGWHQQKIGDATHWKPLPAPPTPLRPRRGC